MKLSVGTSDIGDLRDWQTRWGKLHPPLRHRTRSKPRRSPEILDGGSIYWVINGVMCVRQVIVDIIDDVREDGTACAGIVLDPALVMVEGRRIKAFQGWRYLEAGDVPADVVARDVWGVEELPAALSIALRELCLI